MDAQAARGIVGRANVRLCVASSSMDRSRTKRHSVGSTQSARRGACTMVLPGHVIKRATCNNGRTARVIEPDRAHSVRDAL